MNRSTEQRGIVEERMRILARRNPVYRNLCALVGGLLLQTLAVDPPAPVPPADAAGRLTRGEPMWPPDALPVDWPGAWDLAVGLAESLRDRPGGAALPRLFQWARAQADGGPGLMNSALAGQTADLEAAGREFGLEPSLPFLLLRTAARPWLLAAGETALALAELAGWRRGFCPVCGSPPGLAEIAGQGERTIRCSLCETPWTFPRLACPFCERQETGSLTRLTGRVDEAPAEEGLAVELCGLCGGYVKTMDLRQLAGPLVPPLDDAATWHLDLIAQESQAH